MYNCFEAIYADPRLASIVARYAAPAGGAGGEQEPFRLSGDAKPEPPKFGSTGTGKQQKLFATKGSSADRNLFGAAGVPDDLVFKPKQYSHAHIPDGTVLHTITNEKDGTAVTVKKHRQGYMCSLHDTDAGETLPTHNIFPNYEHAMEHAKKIAGPDAKFG